MTSSMRALITGAGGQDGALLIDRLNQSDWETVGVYSPGSQPTTKDYEASIVCDLSDIDASRDLVRKVVPTHVFHLAAISSVADSWRDPAGTSMINGVAAAALMTECVETQRRAGTEIRFINASSAEIFAGSGVAPQDESTRIAPISPYGAAKSFAHHMATILRSEGLHASNAILYNHESVLRPKRFVTRKITSTVAEIVAGRRDYLALGNLEARRDWGWAPDYVDAMIRMAQIDQPDDFVVATGEDHSVRDFVAAAFEAANIEDWHHLVHTDSEFHRPTDSSILVGDPSKATRELGWKTTKTFSQIVTTMVRHDLSEINHETKF